MLNFACFVVRPGRFYLRRIIDHTTHLLSSVRTAAFGFRLPEEVQADIEWWRAFLLEWNGVSLLYELEWTDAPLIELFTDACLTCYGGRYGDRWFAGAWSPEVLALAQRAARASMPYLELMALAYAVAAWGHLWSTKKIIFRSDCMPAVDAIRIPSAPAAGPPPCISCALYPTRHAGTVSTSAAFTFQGSLTLLRISCLVMALLRFSRRKCGPHSRPPSC